MFSKAAPPKIKKTLRGALNKFVSIIYYTVSGSDMFLLTDSSDGYETFNTFTFILFGIIVLMYLIYELWDCALWWFAIPVSVYLYVQYLNQIGVLALLFYYVLYDICITSNLSYAQNPLSSSKELNLLVQVRYHSCDDFAASLQFQQTTDF